MQNVTLNCIIQTYYTMSSLSNILENPDFLLYLAIGEAVLLLAFLAGASYFRIRIKKLLGGTSAKTIEESLKNMKREIDDLNHFRSESMKYLETAEKRLRRSSQAIETTRFNPFKGTGDGGNQSFSTVILNENGDGVVLSSLYSRERVSIFSKPLKGGASQYELSGEERETLARAKENLNLKSEKKV